FARCHCHPRSQRIHWITSDRPYSSPAPGPIGSRNPLTCPTPTIPDLSSSPSEAARSFRSRRAATPSRPGVAAIVHPAHIAEIEIGKSRRRHTGHLDLAANKEMVDLFEFIEPGECRVIDAPELALDSDSSFSVKDHARVRTAVKEAILGRGPCFAQELLTR